MILNGNRDCPVLPSGMDTGRPPALPEPETIGAHAGVLRVRHEVLAAVQARRRGDPVAPVARDGLDADALKLLHPVPGEGEVGAQVPADIGLIDPHLGTGRVLVLSRGHGNCRITNTHAARTWRIVHSG